jgi:hypothetical protein
MKTCITCKHVLVGLNKQDLSDQFACRHPNNLRENVVSGKFIPVYTCENLRGAMNDVICGYEGKLWEPR